MGELDSARSLTDEQIVSLRTWRAKGRSLTFLSKKYKIGIPMVSMIVRGLRYKSVGGPITPTGKLRAKEVRPRRPKGMSS